MTNKVDFFFFFPWLSKYRSLYPWSNLYSWQISFYFIVQKPYLTTHPFKPFIALIISCFHLSSLKIKPSYFSLQNPIFSSFHSSFFYLFFFYHVLSSFFSFIFFLFCSFPFISSFFIFFLPFSSSLSVLVFLPVHPFFISPVGWGCWIIQPGLILCSRVSPLL